MFFRGSLRGSNEIHQTSNAGLRTETLYLFNKFDTCKEIHAKVNEGPLNALSLVFFLLENEHVMIEKLLQLFICEIDAKLLKTVELKTAHKKKIIQQKVKEIGLFFHKEFREIDRSLTFKSGEATAKDCMNLKRKIRD